MKQLLLPAAAALLAAAVPASASAQQTAPQASPAAEEVSIPLASFGTIRDFRNDGEDVVYLRGTGRQWYKATLAGPCHNLPTALSIALDHRFSSSVDNTATLLVNGERCRIASLVRSDPPPRRSRP
jgi:Family of unknown function (DUF6491)